MDIEREAVVQAAISAVALLVFVGASIFVATTFSTNGNLTSQGGVALVGAIGLFVVVMLGAGVWLERQNF